MKTLYPCAIEDATLREFSYIRRSDMPMRRILVVEEDRKAGNAVAPMFRGGGDVVYVAVNGSDGLRKARVWQPDLIVLNDDSPETNGLGLLKEIRSSGQDTPVILMSSRMSEADRVLAFHMGADDYLVNPMSRVELLARVNSRLRRTVRPEQAENMMEGAVGRFGAVERIGVVEVHSARRVVLRQGSEVALSPKAFDLLSALLRRNGAVATRAELLQEVWDHKGPVVTRTVDLHIVELRQKLEECPASPRHIVTVRKVGYRLDR
jgi:DNA-binding response OmpR family regulator